MTTLQILIAAGSLVGLGVALILFQLVPTQPDLGQALSRLSPAGARQTQARQLPAGTANGSEDVRDVLGSWAERVLPAALWGKVKAPDLAVLGISPARLYGEKILYAFLGLLAGPILSAAVMFSFSIPFYLPVIATLILAAGLWFIPTYNVRTDAADARVAFARSLGAFVDLVTLEMAAGSGPRQAMEAAATVGDSWVFRRLREELARTRWSGITPWDALRGLGEEIDMPDLHELADIMRLSGEDGAAIYPQLKARATSMRAAILSAQKSKANETSEAMTLPMTLLALIFLLILITPQFLRMVVG
ncbi:type II secretion system F family protein [Ornithinimicrobium cryptoxanthini]|uniref:Type II secretion system F family protein n=1 Tax=Ornithinimicrobium cryptoxanthini TaxID=2934161 RepID=A0ABY4YM31_9MICO|nr:type II secretion system F family protein [Ornithinimicrobium cryptoxanthini]USQ77784.1 type II secretion system F family protein [Ornithinimicrobium cryptoxanthini]